MSKKVSIIMPVYNVEKYLVQAMESAVNQDYDNFEIICVDDGSTDASKDILDSYLRYSFVKVIHKENTGYGNSMNIGLEAAVGDYISILEPDDYIAQNTLSSIMSVVDSVGELDFVKCDFAFIKGDDEIEIVPTRIVKNDALYGKLLSREEILELYKGYIAHWTSVYRKDFLKENLIKYNETPGASYQDIGLWFQSLMYAKTGYLLNKYFYHYRLDNPGSSMNNIGKVYCTCDEYDFIEEKINKYAEAETIYPYYVKCRLISVKDTYRRIAELYRKDFLKRAELDFKKIKNKGILDSSKLSTEESEFLNQLLDSSEDLWNLKRTECCKFEEEIKDIEFFYIYGAGNLAQFIYRILDEEGRRKLKGFVVTFSNGQNSIADKPVFEFETIKSELLTSKIIIGVSELYLNEVTTYLKENQINEYFVFKGGIV